MYMVGSDSGMERPTFESVTHALTPSDKWARSYEVSVQPSSPFQQYNQHHPALFREKVKV